MMNKKMSTVGSPLSAAIKIFLLFLAVIVICWLVFTCYRTLFAQQSKITQTDYKDIAIRQKADRDIWHELRRINRQTQADTHTVAQGDTPDTIYLDRKYADTDYCVFVTLRGNQQTSMGGIPLTDSSFAIARDFSGASILVQWMTIHK